MENKEPSRGRATGAAAGRSKGWLARLGGLVGLVGSLLCSLSMVAAPLGLIAAGGTAAAQGGMAGMGSEHQGAGAAASPGWLDVLLRWGPEILVVSVLLIVASVALRRRWAALPAVGEGLILYIGMYVQPNLTLMYGAIVVGTALLILAYAASFRLPERSR
jgi:hypothetical protein